MLQKLLISYIEWNLVFEATMTNVNSTRFYLFLKERKKQKRTPPHQPVFCLPNPKAGPKKK